MEPLPDLQARRGELLKAGQSRGFPLFWYSDTEGIAAGRGAWECFTAQASEAKITAAAESLKKKPRR